MRATLTILMLDVDKPWKSKASLIKTWFICCDLVLSSIALLCCNFDNVKTELMMLSIVLIIGCNCPLIKFCSRASFIFFLSVCSILSICSLSCLESFSRARWTFDSKLSLSLMPNHDNTPVTTEPMTAATIVKGNTKEAIIKAPPVIAPVQPQILRQLVSFSINKFWSKLNVLYLISALIARCSCSSFCEQSVFKCFNSSSARPLMFFFSMRCCHSSLALDLS